MRSIRVVVFEVRLEYALEMIFSEDDDMVQALAPDTAVDPFRIWILPRTMVCRNYFFDAVVAENSSLLMEKDLHRLLYLLDSPIRSAICYSFRFMIPRRWVRDRSGHERIHQTVRRYLGGTIQIPCGVAG